MATSAEHRLDKPNLVMGVLFLVSAALQWNDPDPWGWALIYGTAGIVSIAAARPRRTSGTTWVRPLAGCVALIALVWAAMLAPQALPGLTFRHLFGSMQAETPAVELSREWLGLLWVAVWMIVVLLRRPPALRDPA